jgi:hypothetical protein
MTKEEIEMIVGRLYLLAVHQEQQIAELQAKLAPKPPTIFSMATPREDPA